jgi:hypothetical protein
VGDVVFELLSADGAEEVIGAWLGLLNDIRVLFLIGLLLVEIFEIFGILLFEIVKVVVSILSFIGHWKKGSAKRGSLIKVGVVILADIERRAEVRLERVLGLWIVDSEVMILLGILSLSRSHPAGGLMRCEHSVHLA